MIDYETGAFRLRMICQLRGSVAPFAGFVALPPTILAVLLSYYTRDLGDTPASTFGLDDPDFVAGQAWTGVTSLLGFVLVFRSSQAYSRFWEGTSALYQMSGEWFDAASSCVAFCKRSSAEMGDVAVFQHTLVRLVSMLSAVVLMDLSSPPSWDSEKDGSKKERANLHSPFDEENGRAFELELIDAEGIDRESLLTISESEEKVELIFHWINQLIVEASTRSVFSVQAPVLSRAFHELASGMVKYHDAMKIARIPLPFPYVQTLEILLLLHWMFTPFLTAMWAKSEVWAGILAFLQVFCLWSLNSIAAELENPFGEDVNDLPAQMMQREMNNRLLLLIRPTTQRTARLSEKACLEETATSEGFGKFPTAVGFGKNGVAGFDKANDRLMSRRISLGGLHAAMADEVLIQIEEDASVSELSMGDTDSIASPCSDQLMMQRNGSKTRNFMIREVKASSRGSSKDFGASSWPLGPQPKRGADPVQLREDSAAVPQPLCLRPKNGVDPMQHSEAQSLMSTALVSDTGAQHRLLELFEASRQDLRKLVAICDELRSTSRDLKGEAVSAADQGAGLGSPGGFSTDRRGRDRAASGASAFSRAGSRAPEQGGGGSISPTASLVSGLSASPPPPRGLPDPGSEPAPTNVSRFLSTMPFESTNSAMQTKGSPLSVARSDMSATP